MDSKKEIPLLKDLLADSPKNWGKWGPEDEVGSLNYLTQQQVLRGVSAVRQGKTFTLQIPLGHPDGDPVWPGRKQPQRVNVIDKGHYLCGKAIQHPGHLEYVDDLMIMYLQGSTQFDALGHVWYGDQIWNGYDARTTCGGMTKASVLPLAERGVVGRGVLIDMARYRGKAVMDPGETCTHEDLIACAKKQGVEIQKSDIIILRTGWIGSYYVKGAAEFYKNFNEPGLTYSPELVKWFRDMEIPNLVTDTIANEVTTDPVSGCVLPLHSALMRNLGVVFTEIAQLDALAEDCAKDGQYAFLYVASPLKVINGSGAPVNPVVVK